jgi:hypothetical protein
MLLLLLGGGSFMFSSPAIAKEDAPARVYVEVFVKAERRDEKVAGHLIEHDDTNLTLVTTTGSRRTVAFADLTPNSAYAFKLRFIDNKSSRDWMKLGTWAWSLGFAQQARLAFTNARRLEPELGQSIDDILKSPPSEKPSGKPSGKSEAAPSTQPATADQSGELMGDADDDERPRRRPGGQTRTVTEDGTVQQPIDDVGELVKFQPATPEQHTRAIERAKRRSAAVGRLLRVNLATVETDHFIIFTDWDSAEHQWLANQCEEAYRVVARNFDMDPKVNVFIGKLPAFMFKNQADFAAFAAEFDEFGAPRTVLGYFAGRGDGNGHMAMWKPRVGAGINGAANLADAERRWGRTLIHEFVHAYISRYRSNQRIPRWLDEGIAEVISEDVLPTPNYSHWARQMALHNQDISLVFDDQNMPSVEYYPVMMTLVQMLAKEDRKAFISLFNDIKDGMEPEKALIKNFKVGYDGLQLAWDKYASRLK